MMTRVQTAVCTATDEIYPDVELALKLLLFHVLISTPCDALHQNTRKCSGKCHEKF